MRKKSTPQTLFEKFKDIESIGTVVKAPWAVSRVTGCTELSIVGDQVSIGVLDSDYVHLAEARTAIEWYVNQLGGTVTWPKK